MLGVLFLEFAWSSLAEEGDEIDGDWCWCKSSIKIDNSVELFSACPIRRRRRTNVSDATHYVILCSVRGLEVAELLFCIFGRKKHEKELLLKRVLVRILWKHIWQSKPSWINRQIHSTFMGHFGVWQSKCSGIFTRSTFRANLFLYRSFPWSAFNNILAPSSVQRNEELKNSRDGGGWYSFWAQNSRIVRWLSTEQLL